MQEASLTHPVSILSALRSTGDGALMSVAAFMLAAGARSLPRLISEQLIPDEDLKSLGLYRWWVSRSPSIGRKTIDEYRPSYDVAEQSEEERERYYFRLAEFLEAAIASDSQTQTLQAVALGIESPDDLIRICALTSALELFDINRRDMARRLSWFYERDLNPTTVTLLQMLLLPRPRRSAASHRQLTTLATHRFAPNGLMLIHGTNFPPGRPVWSVPGIGPLFNHIQPLRSDLYGHSDYFRWEGGYSDYAREVGAYNLTDWVAHRSLHGIDAITHSHGGNVLMAATQNGTGFSKVIFLSCPVHWATYRPAVGSILTPISIRIRFDLVVLADRANQRFPANSGIREHLLPIWFTHQ